MDPLTVFVCVCVFVSVRKQDIIKVTEQLIEAISNGDFESYTYVTQFTRLLFTGFYCEGPSWL